MGTVVEGFGRPQGISGDTSGTLTPLWPITVPVSISQQTVSHRSSPA